MVKSKLLKLFYNINKFSKMLRIINEKDSDLEIQIKMANGSYTK